MPEDLIKMFAELRVLLSTVLLKYIEDTAELNRKVTLYKLYEKMAQSQEELETIGELKKNHAVMLDALEETMTSAHEMASTTNELLDNLPAEIRDQHRLDIGVLFQEQLIKYRENNEPLHT